MGYLCRMLTETIILAVQYSSFIMSLMVLGLVLGALPFAIGREVGRRETTDRLVTQSVEDDHAFQIWFAEKKIRKNRQIMSRHYENSFRQPSTV